MNRFAVFCATVFLSLARAAYGQVGGVTWYNNGAFLCSASRANIVGSASCSNGTVTFSAGGVAGVTSVACGTGLTCSPNPIVATGTISLDSGSAVTSLTGGGGITVSAPTGAVTLGSSGGGDVFGAFDGVTVSGLYGVPISNVSNQDGDLLVYLSTGPMWQPQKTIGSASTTITVAGALQVNGNTQIGNATSDALTVYPSTLSFSKETGHTISIAASTTTGVAGGVLSLSAADGAPASGATAGSTGGGFVFSGGNGGAAGAGAGAAGASDNGVLTTGNGGAGTATGAAGASGSLSITTGNAGANGGAGGAGTGTLALDTGAPSGAGVAGPVNIGNSFASGVNVGRSGSTTAVAGNMTLASGKTLVVGGNTLIGSVANKLNAANLAIASQAIGDLLAADSVSTFARIAAGTSGYVLTANGAGFAPSWQALPASGVTSVSATAPIASSGGTTPVISLNSNPGFTGTATVTIGLDKAAAGTLAIGASTATGVSIGGSGVNTTFGGGALLGGTLDMSGASTLNVGTGNASAINIGSSGITIALKGNTTLPTTKTLVVGANTLIGAITDKLNGAMLAVPSQAIGDLLVADSTTTFARLAVGGSSGTVLTSNGAGMAPSWQAVSASGGTAVYGDGSDGAATVSANTTLSTPKYYTTLSVTNNATLTQSVYPIFASTSVTIAAGSSINNNGNNAVGATGGAAQSGASGFYFAGTAGASGGTNTPGSNGTAATGAVCVSGKNRGGSGGAGSSGSGGLSGSCTSALACYGTPRFLPTAVTLTVSTACVSQAIYAAGTGGGSGAGDSGQTGGGGGGGAGNVVIASPTISNSGTISANGGNGGNGSGGNSGGGGGGGAAWVVLIYHSFSGSAATANGGTHGTHSGSSPATDGIDGNAGIVVTLQN